MTEFHDWRGTRRDTLGLRCPPVRLEGAVGCMLSSSGQSLDGDVESARSPTETTRAKDVTNDRPLTPGFKWTEEKKL